MTNFRIGNDLIIILHLGSKFQVCKSKNIEAAYIQKKTLKYGPNRTKWLFSNKFWTYSDLFITMDIGLKF